MTICHNWGEGSGLDIWEVPCENPQENNLDENSQINSNPEKYWNFHLILFLIAILIVLTTVLLFVASTLYR